MGFDCIRSCSLPLFLLQKIKKNGIITTITSIIITRNIGKVNALNR